MIPDRPWTILFKFQVYAISYEENATFLICESTKSSKGSLLIYWWSSCIQNTIYATIQFEKQSLSIINSLKH